MQQQPPQPQASKFSPTLITTEQIQKCLEENQRLIMAIMEYRKQGNIQECAEYQVVLQKNLMYLAALADAQPPTPQISNPSQMMQMQPNTFQQQGNNFMQQPQLVIPQRSSAGESSVQKLPFQQQQQMLQFQQLQGQMGVRPSHQDDMFGMHQVMKSAFLSNPGGQQDGSEAGFGHFGIDGRSVFR